MPWIKTRSTWHKMKSDIYHTQFILILLRIFHKNKFIVWNFFCCQNNLCNTRNINKIPSNTDYKLDILGTNMPKHTCIAINGGHVLQTFPRLIYVRLHNPHIQFQTLKYKMPHNYSGTSQPSSICLLKVVTIYVSLLVRWKNAIS